MGQPLTARVTSPHLGLRFCNNASAQNAHRGKHNSNNNVGPYAASNTASRQRSSTLRRRSARLEMPSQGAAPRAQLRGPRSSQHPTPESIEHAVMHPHRSRARRPQLRLVAPLESLARGGVAEQTPGSTATLSWQARARQRPPGPLDP
ncbi:unnamed protein product [Prorocentrum cordatum]|uniref:Uncharacterized protein n=1 Tax=Prorocentrum cordatum TaxID=2364126 RepID=A0ABN9S7K8_9DINO|nr:unnamed protein product [Polarella glacialis]